MAISSVGSYTNSYENLYTYNQTKKSETSNPYSTRYDE